MRTSSHPVTFVAVTLLLFLTTSCRSSQPDFTPFAVGLKALGICVVVATVVSALADLVKSETKAARKDRKQKEAGQTQPRHSGQRAASGRSGTDEGESQ